MTQPEEGNPPSHPQRPATRLLNGGRDPFVHHGYVNPPVYHASTLLYRTAGDYLAVIERVNRVRKSTDPEVPDHG